MQLQNMQNPGGRGVRAALPQLLPAYALHLGVATDEQRRAVQDRPRGDPGAWSDGV